ncbi:MAG: hypothetical protein WCV62_06685 [Candidatus Peribacteraceae bacterium]|jgi:hypothetical protein
MSKARKQQTHDISRLEATLLIEKLRTLIYESKYDTVDTEDLEDLFRQGGIPLLTKCNGEAHDNPFIDNCGICMPRWGVCGKPVRVK